MVEFAKSSDRKMTCRELEQDTVYIPSYHWGTARLAVRVNASRALRLDAGCCALGKLCESTLVAVEYPNYANQGVQQGNFANRGVYLWNREKFANRCRCGKGKPRSVRKSILGLYKVRHSETMAEAIA